MTVIVKHNFNCSLPDDPVTSAEGGILISHWNANHTISGTPNNILNLDSSGTLTSSSLGVDYALTSGKLISTLNFLDYAYTNATTQVDVTTALQDFIVTCYLEAVTHGALSLSDQTTRSRVRMICPHSAPLHVNCPISVLPFCDWDFTTTLERYADGGTVTTFYNGDTTTKALGNLYQPTLIIPPGGHASNFSIFCDGDSNGAGFYAGRAWVMQGNPIIGVAGSGYTNGDTVSVINPHLSPYTAATYTLTVSGGVVTAATLVQGGVWPAPPKILRKMWGTGTNASGQNWADLAAASTPHVTAVFDANGYWKTTGGTGTGLTLNISDTTTNWVADFSGGKYASDFSSYLCNMVIGTGFVSSAGTTTDATYGPMRAVTLTSNSIFIGSISTGGGYQGISCFSSDTQFGSFYTVGAAQANFKKFAGTNLNGGTVICDTPLAGARYADLDHFTNSNFTIKCFNNGSVDLTGMGYAIKMGSLATNIMTGNNLTFNFQNAGIPSGCPAVFVDYNSGSTLNLNVTNIATSGGGASAYPLSSLVTFGTHNGTKGTINGYADGMTGSLYSGTFPIGWGMNVWDASVGGYAGPQGVYTIYGSGAPTDGTTGANKAAKGSSYIDYTNGAAYLNTGTISSPTWSAISTGAGGGSPGGTSGQVQYNNSGSFGGFTVGGDATLNTGTGALTVTKTNGVSFAPSATTDTTSAANISSGTLPAARLPNPSASSLGGVQSCAAVSNQFITSISTLGVPASAQPSFSNLSGTLLAAQTQSGPFASRPGSPTQGLRYIATDLGAAGIEIMYDGTKWKPVCGIATILCDSATHTGAGTGAEANFANFKIPAGLVSATGAFRITATGSFTGTSATKAMLIRHTTVSGSTSGGTTLINANFGGSSTTLSIMAQKTVYNDGSVSAQTTTNSGIGGLGVSSSTAVIAGAINMANDSYINFNITGSPSDTVGYKGLLVEWIEA